MGKAILILMLIVLGIAITPYLITFLIFLVALLHG